MGSWESEILGRLPLPPVEVGHQLLRGLGLPVREELRELAEMGFVTLDAALAHDSPELLADYLAFAAHRFAVLTPEPVTGRRLRDQLQVLLGGLAADELARVDGFVAHALDACAAAAGPDAGRPPRLGTLARDYLDHVLAGRQEAAVAVVTDAALAGTDLTTLLTEVLEAAQVEIGRLWEEGRISIAQEHYCTAVTQMAMTALQPYLFSGAVGRPRLVAVNAPGSLHEVGLRMVVDLLEHEGWETTYLGVEPPERVVAVLADLNAQVLAVSASMPTQLGAVAELVRAVRADPRTATVAIMVGGRPFQVAPALVAAVGADAMARDARDAVVTCARLAEARDVTV